MFSRYRIKEVRGKFIPQKWFLVWEGIDKTSDYLWNSDEHQYEWCASETLEQARARIQEYQRYKNEVKYHKI